MSQIYDLIKSFERSVARGASPDVQQVGGKVCRKGSRGDGKHSSSGESEVFRGLQESGRFFICDDIMSETYKCFEFVTQTEENGSLLQSDALISHHLDILYDKMLESNLLKIIHPYSVVEIDHVSRLINLSKPQVVQKLSQMILDQKFYGILDEGKGHLIIYDSSNEDYSFSKSVEILGNLGSVVDALFHRAKGLGKTNE